MTENDRKPVILPEEEATESEFAQALAEARKAATIVLQTVTQGLTRLDAVDSLQSNEFAVELEGVVVSGIFRVSGLTTFNLSAQAHTLFLIKMVQRDATLPFNRWLKESMEAPKSGPRPTRTLAVLAVDDGEETRRWMIEGAFITSVQYSEFDTASGELLEEIITIQYASVTEQWTWNDKQ
jgi:hypothetical protein